MPLFISGADIDLTAAYLARFPAPAAGQRVFVRLAAMTQGFKDTPHQWDALAAPRGLSREPITVS